MLSNFIDRIKLPFRKDKELYSSLYAIIGFYPRDISLYKQALLHSSVARRNAKGRPMNNERLEFLGDAILDAAVGDIVFRHFPRKREGFLTNTRSKLVQRETLNKLAKEMGIDSLVLSNGRNFGHNSYVGGNAFEALVGAIYLDRGYEACMRFMEKRILAQMINLDKMAYKEVNFKSKLLEWSQKNRVKLEFKTLTEQKDKDGSPVFKSVVWLENVEGCTGTGFSKKESQQKAARSTLERLRKRPQFIDAVFASKADRTKMEEEPVEQVPQIEPKDDFIITQQPDTNQGEKHEAIFKEEVFTDSKPRARRRSPVYEAATGDEFDLSDISAAEKSREDIIAAAEAAAFSEEHEDRQA